MKAKFLFILFFLATITQSGFSQHAVQHNGPLSVHKTQLVNQWGEAVVLRGVSYGWHNWWPRFYNTSSVEWLANDWKCNVVRAALGVGPKNSYLDKTAWSMSKVRAIIDGAIKSGIYVIVDWHSHEIHTSEAMVFFDEISKEYGHYPNLIYEIFNEPVHDSWETVKKYSVEVIKAIRKNDPDNIILVGSPHWDQDIHLVADAPITGFSNLMYTVHFYAATHGQELRQRSEYALDKGIPIFISECAGMEASGNGPIDHQSWEAWLNWMESKQISWLAWSVADKNETCSMLKPIADDTGNWQLSDLKEWGLKTRETLRSFANARK